MPHKRETLAGLNYTTAIRLRSSHRTRDRRVGNLVIELIGGIATYRQLSVELLTLLLQFLDGRVVFFCFQLLQLLKKKKKNTKMSIFRSERMSLWQMILQNESAYNCVAEMGELGVIEFRDVSLYFLLQLIK